MFTVVITEKGGAQRRMDFDKNEVTIGRVQGNDIILPKGNVSKRHSRIVLKDNRFIVVDLKSTNGTYVNGRKITSPLVVKPGDKVYIGDFILTLEESQQAYEEPPAPPGAPPPPAPEPEPPPPARAQPAPQAAAPQRRRSQVAPPPLRAQPPAAPRRPAPPPLPARQSEPPPAAERFPLDEDPSEGRPAPPASVASGGHARAARAEPARAPAPAPARAPVRAARPPGATGEVDPGLRSLMIRLSQAFDVYDADPGALHDQERWSQAQHAIENAIGELQNEGQLAPNVDRERLAAAALREAVGLGALEPLLSDDSVREVVVEGPARIVADFGNGLEPVDASFSSGDAVLTAARRLIAQAGEHYDDSRAIYETTLPYGPHVTVVFPPVAVRGTVIEIRRMGRNPTAESLVESGWMSPEMLEFLRDAVRQRRNVVVAGAIGSGVTTLLGALAGLTGEHERLVTVEDVPDLMIDRDHVIGLGARSTNGSMKFRDVLIQASKLRSDRLVVDDVRGEECWDVLATVAARRPGNFIGVHAAQGGDAIEHIKRLARMNGHEPAEVTDLLASAVNVVVQVECAPDGARRVTRIAEVLGARGDEVQARDLYVYDGQFSKVG